MSANAVALADEEPQAAGISDKIKPGPVMAPCYILVDVATGRILAERNSHQHMFPASTTKTMTALVALTYGKLDQTVTVGPAAAATGESSIGLQVGETFTLADLLRAALIKSANDSCVAIAEGVAGNVPAFVDLMNKKARELGALDTHFANPHGLHNPDHYTSAYDLALIARADLRFPFFDETIDTHETSIHGNAKVGAQRILVNRNRLLFRWNQCDGVKTGYTKQAGRCLVATATRIDPASGKPWRLLSVVLHAPDSWSDSYNLMTTEGFGKYTPTRVEPAGAPIVQANVPDGGSTEAVPASDVMLPLLPGEQAGIVAKPHLWRLKAPIAKGQRIGTLVFNLEGKKLGSVPLVAADAVAVSLASRMLPLGAGIWPLGRKHGIELLAGLLVLISGCLLALRRNRKNVRYEQTPARRGSPNRDGNQSRGGSKKSGPTGKTGRQTVRR